MTVPCKRSDPPYTVCYVGAPTAVRKRLADRIDAALDLEFAAVSNAEACGDRLLNGDADCVVSEWAVTSEPGRDILDVVRAYDATLPLVTVPAAGRSASGHRVHDPSEPAPVGVGDGGGPSDELTSPTTSVVGFDRHRRPRARHRRASPRGSFPVGCRDFGPSQYGPRLGQRLRWACPRLGIRRFQQDTNRAYGIHPTAEAVGFLPASTVIASELLDSIRTAVSEPAILTDGGQPPESDPAVEEHESVGDQSTNQKDPSGEGQPASEAVRRLTSADDAAAVATRLCETATDTLAYEVAGVYLADRSDGTLRLAATSDSEPDESFPIDVDEGAVWNAFDAGNVLVTRDLPNQSTAPADGPPADDGPARGVAVPLGEYGVFVARAVPADGPVEATTTATVALAAAAEATFERISCEQKLEGQYDKLAEFASLVSHDLRNPLAVGDGNLDIVRSMAGDEASQFVEQVDWALGRLETLIDDSVTLIRSGLPVSEPESVSLEEAFEHAHEAVESAPGVVVDGPLPTVEGDDERLERLFRQCIENAREHAGEDATLTVTATDDGFVIADDGPGIGSEHEAKVFDGGYTTTKEGTGFGLAIVAEIADAHGWSVSVGESDTGGARFEFEFV